MVKRLIFVFFIAVSEYGAAQDSLYLTLPQAYAMAEKNYPVTRQLGLIEQTAGLTIENLNKGYLPQVTLSGQATYQSDVTKVAVPIPGLTIQPPSKDQYKILADVNQLIYDGGVIRQQKQIAQLNAEVNTQQARIDLYKVKDRINQLYLGILLLDQQLKQVELVKADLETGMKRVEAQVNNGVSLRSNLSVLKAEWLKADQRKIELNASRKGLLETLGLFLGKTFSGSTVLETPDTGLAPAGNDIARPEIEWFRRQSEFLSGQQNLIKAKSLPKASVFVQGGYGRPGLNLLDNEFSLYYIGGLRFSWSLGSLYTRKKEGEIVDVNKRIIDIQQETFLLNTNAQLKQQAAEIDKLQQLAATDNEIIALRQQVKEAAKAQLENNVITANDYLREVNAEDQARQSLILHRLQLLQAYIIYQTISGKQ